MFSNSQSSDPDANNTRFSFDSIDPNNLFNLDLSPSLAAQTTPTALSPSFYADDLLSDPDRLSNKTYDVAIPATSLPAASIPVISSIQEQQPTTSNAADLPRAYVRLQRLTPEEINRYRIEERATALANTPSNPIEFIREDDDDDDDDDRNTANIDSIAYRTRRRLLNSKLTPPATPTNIERTRRRSKIPSQATPVNIQPEIPTITPLGAPLSISVNSALADPIIPTVAEPIPTGAIDTIEVLLRQDLQTNPTRKCKLYRCVKNSKSTNARCKLCLSEATKRANKDSCRFHKSKGSLVETFYNNELDNNDYTRKYWQFLQYLINSIGKFKQEILNTIKDISSIGIINLETGEIVSRRIGKFDLNNRDLFFILLRNACFLITVSTIKLENKSSINRIITLIDFQCKELIAPFYIDKLFSIFGYACTIVLHKFTTTSCSETFLYSLGCFFEILNGNMLSGSFDFVFPQNIFQLIRNKIDAHKFPLFEKYSLQ